MQEEHLQQPTTAPPSSVQVTLAETLSLPPTLSLATSKPNATSKFTLFSRKAFLHSHTVPSRSEKSAQTRERAKHGGSARETRRESVRDIGNTAILRKHLPQTGHGRLPPHTSTTDQNHPPRLCHVCVCVCLPHSPTTNSRHSKLPYRAVTDCCLFFHCHQS